MGSQKQRADAGFRRMVPPLIKQHEDLSLWYDLETGYKTISATEDNVRTQWQCVGFQSETKRTS